MIGIGQMKKIGGIIHGREHIVVKTLEWGKGLDWGIGEN